MVGEAWTRVRSWVGADPSATESLYFNRCGCAWLPPGRDDFSRGSAVGDLYDFVGLSVSPKERDKVGQHTDPHLNGY